MILTELQTKKLSKDATSKIERRRPEKITPTPCFVIKTMVFSSFRNAPPGTKLFINVCTHPIVPLPPNAGKGDAGTFDPVVVFPLIMKNEWEIPILTSPQIRDGKDKKGQACLIIDCVINDRPMRWCMANKDLQQILVQWCFDAVEFQVGGNFLIDRDVAVLPKRAYMGSAEDLEVDQEAISNDPMEVEELSNQFKSDKPANLLEAKRLNDEEGEITELKIAPDHGAKPLIEEITERKEVSAQPKQAELVMPVEPVAASQEQSVKFTVDFKKLDNSASQEFSYLLKVTSELKSASLYSIQYNKEKNSLLVSSRGRPGRLDFPLPLVQGVFSVYFLSPIATVYIFVK